MAAHRHFGADTVVFAERPRAAADLNVTPLIDVLLVLLVIFMATLPLAQRSIDTDLPAQTARGDIPGVSPIVLEYTADRQISINQQPVVLGELQERLTTVYESRHDKTMFIAGAGSLRYGEIVQVIDAAKRGWSAARWNRDGRDASRREVKRTRRSGPLKVRTTL